MGRRAKLSGDLEIVGFSGEGGNLIVAGGIRLARNGEEIDLATPCEKFIHVQNTAATVWTVDHNLGTANPVVIIYNTTGGVILASVSIESNNQVKIGFASAITGRAVIVKV